MHDDYLWDGSGAPDPEIQRLESLLSEFCHSDRPLTLPPTLLAVPTGSRGLLFEASWLPRLAAATFVLFALAAGVLLSLRPVRSSKASAGWDVATLAGTPQVGSQILSGNHATSKLQVGQTLVTNSDSRASISDKDLGEIKVDPNSRVRLLETGERRKRIQLEVGTIHAAIWAPAGQFVVDTPSAVAVDLGCVYTLQVDDSGAGLLRTTMGWVGFKLNGHESFIPAGAVCRTRPKIGPGTPYFEDTSPAFREALTNFDFAKITLEERVRLLEMLLTNSRKQDALTLWHLLPRVSDRERPGVYDRLAVLAPPPADVTREGVLRLDQKMLDSWWNSLGYGDVYFWYMYERTWSER